MRRDSLKHWVLVAAVLAASGCRTPADVRPDVADGAPYRLRILHINDHHSRLDPDAGQQLRLDDAPTDVSLGGFPRLVTAFRELAAEAPNVLRLHSGDAMSGDLYHTLFNGEADADLMNQVCFDAFVPGNHEFDRGDDGLKAFLDYLSKRLWTCDTPAVAANVHPTVGDSPLRQSAQAGYLRPQVVVERGGRRIGIVGLVAAKETRASSNPLASTAFEDEAASAQRQIDALRADGVAIVVVLSHIGYAPDRALASQLSGVDLIVGGHSHSPLGEGLKALGINSDGPYPTLAQNRDGERVCIVQAWQYGWAVGALDAEFDADGRVLGCSGRPYLMLGDDWRRAGQPVDDATRARIEAEARRTPELRRFEPDPAASEVLAWYAQRKQAQSSRVIAQAPKGLCLRRAPAPFDRGRDGRPGCAEATDAQGGEVQALVASAMLAAARDFGGADVSLQNGGGTRSSIAAGDFKVGDAFNILPFRNTLVILDLSGAELVSALNAAADFMAEAPETRTGSYPYAAGLRWKIDLSAPAGQRVQALELWADGQAAPVQPDARYRVAVSDYLASGRDGYTPLGQIPAERRADTARDMAQALIDFVSAQGTVVAPAKADRSTQGFVAR